MTLGFKGIYVVGTVVSAVAAVITCSAAVKTLLALEKCWKIVGPHRGMRDLCGCVLVRAPPLLRGPLLAGIPLRAHPLKMKRYKEDYFWSVVFPHCRR